MKCKKTISLDLVKHTHLSLQEDCKSRCMRLWLAVQSGRSLEGKVECLACSWEAAFFFFSSWCDTLQGAATLGYIFLLCSENIRKWGEVVMVIATQQNIS